MQPDILRKQEVRRRRISGFSNLISTCWAANLEVKGSRSVGNDDEDLIDKLCSCDLRVIANELNRFQSQLKDALKQTFHKLNKRLES